MCKAPDQAMSVRWERAAECSTFELTTAVMRSCSGEPWRDVGRVEFPAHRRRHDEPSSDCQTSVVIRSGRRVVVPAGPGGRALPVPNLMVPLPIGRLFDRAVWRGELEPSSSTVPAMLVTLSSAVKHNRFHSLVVQVSWL